MGFVDANNTATCLLSACFPFKNTWMSTIAQWCSVWEGSLSLLCEEETQRGGSQWGTQCLLKSFCVRGLRIPVPSPYFRIPLPTLCCFPTYQNCTELKLYMLMEGIFKNLTQIVNAPLGGSKYNQKLFICQNWLLKTRYLPAIVVFCKTVC